MLERERHDVLDTLNRHREGMGIPRKALTDDDLDAANAVGWVPEALAEEFLLETRKLEQC